MPVEVVSYMLSNKDIRKRLQFQIILQCAPFLKGIKIACITNIETRYCKELGIILADTDIEYKILTVHKGRCLVFFYRREEFVAYLNKAEVKEFLEYYGYEIGTVDLVMRRLSARVCQYSRNEDCFPHEIGAFLDYPIDDVRCFIKQGGKGCLMTGYWKVYNNPEKAQMTFLAYDKAKTSAVNEFLVGKTIQDIAYKAA